MNIGYSAILGSHEEFRENESGFGVIEILISIFLLGVLSISFVPVVINSWKSTGVNTTIATATQIVNEKIEGARAVRSPSATTPSCNDVVQFLQVTLPPVIDPRGVTLQPKWNTPTCPLSYPGVVRANVSVTRLGSSVPVASAVTLIFVSSAV